MIVRDGMFAKKRPSFNITYRFFLLMKQCIFLDLSEKLSI